MVDEEYIFLRSSDSESQIREQLVSTSQLFSRSAERKRARTRADSRKAQIPISLCRATQGIAKSAKARVYNRGVLTRRRCSRLSPAIRPARHPPATRATRSTRITGAAKTARQAPPWVMRGRQIQIKKTKYIQLRS